MCIHQPHLLHMQRNDVIQHCLDQYFHDGVDDWLKRECYDKAGVLENACKRTIIIN